MQTSSVANLVASPAPTAAAKQAEPSSGVTPFNDVLSREVTARRNADAGKPEANATPQPAGNAKASEAKPQSADKSKAQADSDTATDDGTDATASATAPADMLALVASLKQAVPADQVPTATAAADSEPRIDTAGAAADAAGALAASAANAAQSGKPVRTTAGDTDTSRLDDNLTHRQAAGHGKNGKPQAETAVNRTGDMPAAAKPAPEAALKTAEAASGAAMPKPDFAAEIKEALNTQPAVALQQVQPALANAAQAAAGVVADKLTPSVGTPAWDQALGQKVVWMVAGEQQSASLTLNPPDLGPLQVVLNVSNSQASATFTAAQPEVRQALEAALPRLREMLGEAGIQLGQATVNSGAPNQQGSQEQRQSHASPRGETVGASGVEASLRTSRMPTTASGRGLVDTFV